MQIEKAKTEMLQRSLVHPPQGFVAAKEGRSWFCWCISPCSPVHASSGASPTEFHRTYSHASVYRIAGCVSIRNLPFPFLWTFYEASLCRVRTLFHRALLSLTRWTHLRLKPIEHYNLFARGGSYLLGSVNACIQFPDVISIVLINCVSCMLFTPYLSLQCSCGPLYHRL